MDCPPPPPPSPSRPPLFSSSSPGSAPALFYSVVLDQLIARGKTVVMSIGAQDLHYLKYADQIVVLGMSPPPRLPGPAPRMPHTAEEVCIGRQP